MSVAKEFGTGHEDEHEVARMLLRSYLELKTHQEGATDARFRALRSDAMDLFPRAFWLNLAKQVCIHGLSLEEELSACQAQRLSAEQDSAHPLSQIWRPESEAHFQAIVARMKEGLSWAEVTVLEHALVAACGFIDKRGLEQSYCPAQRARHEYRRDRERRCAAWHHFLNLTPTLAEHFESWLDCESVDADYVVGRKPGDMDSRPFPPQFYLSLCLRFPDGRIPDDEDRQYGRAAFSEDIPPCVEDCRQLLNLDAVGLLSLKAVPWPAWNVRMDALVAELADRCGCDSDEARTALNRVSDNYPKGYEAMSERLEELDTWLALTRTSTTERDLEENERCATMAVNLYLREPQASAKREDDLDLIGRARTRLLRHGIKHPSATLLSPADALWLWVSARGVAKQLGERAAGAYLQTKCAAPLAETLSRIDAMRPYWSEGGEVHDRMDTHLDWEAALQNLPAELGAFLAGDNRSTSGHPITATRKEWLQCFSQLPPSWLDCAEGYGPPVGQLLAALPDEAIMEASVDDTSEFQEFITVKFPLADLPAVVACAASGILNLQKLKPSKKAHPPIGSGWVEAYWG